MSQPLPLREQLKALEHLQELDLKIDQLKKRKAGLPVAMKSLEESFQKARAAVDAKKNGIGELEKLQRQTQAAIDLNGDRQARANSKLEQVHNGQEYSAATKEVDQLKKMNSTLEEQIKKAGNDIAALQKDLGDLEGKFGQVQTERDAQMAVIGDQTSQLDKEVGTLVSERSQHTPKVEPRILNAYERVRVGRAGIGIAPAVGGRCSGCNMMLPAQQYNDVQRASAVQSCPSCNRILFIPSAQASAG